MTEQRKSRLAWRVYAFTAALAIAIITVLTVLPKYMRSAKFYEPHAALMQHMVDRWSTRDAKGLDESLARFEPRVRGKLTVYATDGRLIRTMGTAALAPPTSDELAALRTGKWSLTQERIVVRSDDNTLVAVYAPNRTFPWAWVLSSGAVILLVVGAASMWFARRLAIPLDRLANTARRFGAGDITARAELHRDDEVGAVGRAFDDMAERTANVIASQRRLMADVSHELRTPLSRIRVALELAAEDPVAAKDVLADVAGDLDEIDQLIEDILTTARLDGERAQINRTPTKLADLVERATQRFKARHPRRALETKFPAELDDKVLDCDPVLLRRALDNLLDNAAKYSDTPVELRVSNGASIVLEVVDHGIGMSADELAQAFTPFWRADGSRTRKTGGVGLGLALARRIARAHGGEITLVSAPGQGTTARIDVPAA